MIERKAPAVKTVHLAVYDTLADWEVGHAIAHVNNPRWQRAPGTWRVVTVGRTTDAVTTMGGMRIVPDIGLADLRPEDSAMLILPGADTWLDGSNDDFALAARRFVEAGVPVAAICGATAGLASVGLLDDRRHTSNAAVFLEGTGYAGGSHYRDEPATTDRLVTTASATAPVAFAREVLGVLGVYEPSVLDSWTKLYRDRDPAGFYELMAVGAR
jgi:putative intracellular protease/amidase